MALMSEFFQVQASRNEFTIGARAASQGSGLLFTIHEAERLTAWGPGASSRAPGGVQGAVPRKLWGFSICKRPRKALLELFQANLNPVQKGFNVMTPLTV